MPKGLTYVDGSATNSAEFSFVSATKHADGTTTLLQTIDVQTTTIHSTPGYDAETGVGSPGPRFFSLR